MTERAVWLKLAKAIREDVANEFFMSGLCYHLDYLCAEAVVPKQVRWAVAYRIEAYVDSHKWGAYGWPLSIVGHRQRIAFCKRQVARIDRARRKR